MRRSRLTVAAVTLALVGAVVALRGGTAADEDGLAGPVEPSPATSPEVGPRTGPQGGELSANGLPGLRLGTRPESANVYGQALRNGCAPVGSVTEVGDWGVSGWAVDDRVESVVVSSYAPVPARPVRLSTWLGPTLGSPIQAAQELARARTVTERPFGPDGPSVSVVTVPARGVEVVFADAPVTSSPGVQEDGAVPITSIEVRTPRARDCDMAEFYARSGWGDEVTVGLEVDPDGTGALRLGARVEDLLATDGVVAEATGAVVGAGSTCRSFTSVETGQSVRAVAVDDVVTEVQVSGRGFGTTFGLPAGADVDDVRARFPELASRSEESLAAGLTVTVDDVTVELRLQPDLAWVPDLDQPVFGEDLRLGGVVLREPGSLPYPC